MGPTASGKSALAEALADQLDAHLINADAFQIYRGMDIGTGKSDHRTRYSLLDIRNPDESFGVGEFVELASQVLRERFEIGQNVVMVGGTGLYIRALTEGYSEMHPEPPEEIRTYVNKLFIDEGLPKLIEKLVSVTGNPEPNLDVMNPMRVKRALEKALFPAIPLNVDVPAFRIEKIGLLLSSDETIHKIVTRVAEMMQNGWVTEVKELLSSGYGINDPGFRAIGYRTIAEHLEGQLDIEQVTEQVKTETIRYAKRQRTWLRKEPSLKIVGSLGEGLEIAARKITTDE